MRENREYQRIINNPELRVTHPVLFKFLQDHAEQVNAAFSAEDTKEAAQIALVKLINVYWKPVEEDEEVRLYILDPNDLDNSCGEALSNLGIHEIENEKLGEIIAEYQDQRAFYLARHDIELPAGEDTSFRNIRSIYRNDYKEKLRAIKEHENAIGLDVDPQNYELDQATADKNACRHYASLQYQECQTKYSVNPENPQTAEDCIDLFRAGNRGRIENGIAREVEISGDKWQESFFNVESLDQARQKLTQFLYGEEAEKELTEQQEKFAIQIYAYSLYQQLLEEYKDHSIISRIIEKYSVEIIRKILEDINNELEKNYQTPLASLKQYLDEGIKIGFDDEDAEKAYVRGCLEELGIDETDVDNLVCLANPDASFNELDNAFELLYCNAVEDKLVRERCITLDRKKLGADAENDPNSDNTALFTLLNGKTPLLQQKSDEKSKARADKIKAYLTSDDFEAENAEEDDEEEDRLVDGRRARGEGSSSDALERPRNSTTWFKENILDHELSLKDIQKTFSEKFKYDPSTAQQYARHYYADNQRRYLCQQLAKDVGDRREFLIDLLSSETTNLENGNLAKIIYCLENPNLDIEKITRILTTSEDVGYLFANLQRIGITNTGGELYPDKGEAWKIAEKLAKENRQINLINQIAVPALRKALFEAKKEGKPVTLESENVKKINDILFETTKEYEEGDEDNEGKGYESEEAFITKLQKYLEEIKLDDILDLGSFDARNSFARSIYSQCEEGNELLTLVRKAVKSEPLAEGAKNKKLRAPSLLQQMFHHLNFEEIENLNFKRISERFAEVVLNDKQVDFSNKSQLIDKTISEMEVEDEKDKEKIRKLLQPLDLEQAARDVLTQRANYLVKPGEPTNLTDSTHPVTNVFTQGNREKEIERIKKLLPESKHLTLTTWGKAAGKTLKTLWKGSDGESGEGGKAGFKYSDRIYAPGWLNNDFHEVRMKMLLMMKLVRDGIHDKEQLKSVLKAIGSVDSIWRYADQMQSDYGQKLEELRAYEKGIDTAHQAISREYTAHSTESGKKYRDQLSSLLSKVKRSIKQLEEEKRDYDFLFVTADECYHLLCEKYWETEEKGYQELDSILADETNNPRSYPTVCKMFTSKEEYKKYVDNPTAANNRAANEFISEPGRSDPFYIQSYPVSSKEKTEHPYYVYPAPNQPRAFITVHENKVLVENRALKQNGRNEKGVMNQMLAAGQKALEIRMKSNIPVQPRIDCPIVIYPKDDAEAVMILAVFAYLGINTRYVLFPADKDPRSKTGYQEEHKRLTAVAKECAEGEAPRFGEKLTNKGAEILSFCADSLRFGMQLLPNSVPRELEEEKQGQKEQANPPEAEEAHPAPDDQERGDEDPDEAAREPQGREERVNAPVPKAPVTEKASIPKERLKKMTEAYQPSSKLRKKQAEVETTLEEQAKKLTKEYPDLKSTGWKPSKTPAMEEKLGVKEKHEESSTTTGPKHR